MDKNFEKQKDLLDKEIEKIKPIPVVKIKNEKRLEGIKEQFKMASTTFKEMIDVLEKREELVKNADYQKNQNLKEENKNALNQFQFINNTLKQSPSKGLEAIERALEQDKKKITKLPLDARHLLEKMEKELMRVVRPRQTVFHHMAQFFTHNHEKVVPKVQ